MNLLAPWIDRRLARECYCWEAERARVICDFLDKPLVTIAERERFYDVCSVMLANRKSERILLYLPFTVLKGAPRSFRDAYMDAWHRLLCVYDVRENFHLGDCFELDARPPGGLERVVKCAHLTPWLIAFGYLGMEELLSILTSRDDDLTLLQSFKDTWTLVRKKQLLSVAEVQRLELSTKQLPPREPVEPLYVSEGRRLWLESLNRPDQPISTHSYLAGPFGRNLPMLKPLITELAGTLHPNEVRLVGGSRLKGYGCVSSDLDVSSLEDLLSGSDTRPGQPQATHIYLSRLWLGGDKATSKDMASIVECIAQTYVTSRPEIKRQSIEQLEIDLLLYRLLHKGYARAIGWNGLSAPMEMDGDCPFYDDGYRRLATKLYARYVWL